MELLKAYQLGVTLMEKYNLDKMDWSFEFDNAKRRFGCCNYRKKKITLSAPLTELRDESFVKNTILHEIAHALVGGRHGHDNVWRAKAIEIGCNGNRCSSDVEIKGKWIGTCPNGHTKHRHRKPSGSISCGTCSNVYDPKYTINFKLA
jgi:predicted SprT family Zn-dependent metalloprotease